jgi:hypothetical protein
MSQVTHFWKDLAEIRAEAPTLSRTPAYGWPANNQGREIHQVQVSLAPCTWLATTSTPRPEKVSAASASTYQETLSALRASGPGCSADEL